MELIIFTLLLRSSAECFSPDTAASRRRRQRSKHWPEHHDHVRVTHSEGRRGQRPRHRDQVPATHKERRRGQRPGHLDQVPATNNCRIICRLFFSCCDSVAWPQAAVWAPALKPRSRMCDRSYVQRLHLVESTSPRVLPCLCAHGAGNIYSAALLICRV
jgi:hypothetical protein